MEARNRSESPIPMDFATCLSNVDDGSVTIRRDVIPSLVALIFFGLSLLGLISMVIVGLLEHRLRDVDIDGWGAVGGGIVLLGLVTFLAARSLLRPSIHFNARSNILEIGRGKRLREIPFSSISQVSVGQKWKAGDTGAKVGIQVTLDNGDVVKLGTVSGSGAEARAAAIAERIAATTGAGTHPTSPRDATTHTMGARIRPSSPHDAKSFYQQGVALYRKGEDELALARYSKAIELDPTFSYAYYGRGMVFKDLNQLDKAIADFEQFLALIDDQTWRDRVERILNELRVQR